MATPTPSMRASGKRVRKPSRAALPALSVTPGLKPTVMTRSGVSENRASSLSHAEPRRPTSMIGSTKRSSTRSPSVVASKGLRTTKPQMDRTRSTLRSKSWSKRALTTLPRTSTACPSILGVTSTRTSCMMFPRCRYQALSTLLEHFDRHASMRGPPTGVETMTKAPTSHAA